MTPAFAHITKTLHAGAAVLAATLLVLSMPLAAAPSEGTSGQTVTARSLHRPDGSLRPGSAATSSRTPTLHAGPAWKDLSATQQQALQPLAAHWDTLNEPRKQKWLAISNSFQSLPADEQAKMHRRMSQWVTLSQLERAQARQNFQDIKTLTTEQKTTHWEAYKALSTEEKRKLAAQAGPSPNGLALIKPTTLPKLAKVPAPRSTGTGARMAEAVSPIRTNTLLPKPEAPRVEQQRPPAENEPTDAQAQLAQ